MDLASARVAVLMGGTSAERAVSLDSGRSVVAALRAHGDGAGPAGVTPVDWCADGAFDFEGRRLGFAAALERLAGFDATFLALHGGAGEDGTLQGALELAGVAYTGSGVAASALAMDKARSKLVAAAAGAPGAPSAVVTRAGHGSDSLAALEPLAARGAFLKPARGGSSLGVARVAAGGDALAAALAAALETADAVLVEALVDGLEVTCAVLDTGGEARALPVVEIVPARGAFFDYRQKYDADGAFERCPAELLGAGGQELVRRRALAVHRAFGCRGLTRTDFIVRRPEADADCDPVFLELNTLPGFTARSLAPQAAAAAGLSYRALCVALLEDALARRSHG